MLGATIDAAKFKRLELKYAFNQFCAPQYLMDRQ